ncbi:DNA-directed RNA polymerase subunit beta [Lactiplantibacillus sp. WILCCON 0030]|uniref:DNA-directed RNA polymerase subunit beta n=1 Tax=Lactiplantibacillus brownii TaxID=3069269 RepID=A0ABU1AC85_9LACO|nr:DNA-directed RNA polymerase subunit beta [Lactiplantibacillus brownii]MDQ7937983.1 DNA-directed RNA polymerase subunit beta [Lactiplantibacillus brownii]
MERIVPREKWLYDDRGMLKWMGWILSDHSAYMESVGKQTRPREVKPEMPVTQISANLQKAWKTGQAVIVQSDTLENNCFTAEYHGQVAGYQGDQIYLQLANDSVKFFHLDELRYVEIPTAEKWWSHDDTTR